MEGEGKITYQMLEATLSPGSKTKEKDVGIRPFPEISCGLAEKAENLRSIVEPNIRHEQKTLVPERLAIKAIFRKKIV